jgi:GAF domain-containing protein
MPQEQDSFAGVASSMAAFVLGRQPLDQTLARVAELARDAVAGADYAAVTTLRDGRAETTVATDPMITKVDQAQYDADCGPCLDAFRAGSPRRLDRTEDDARWPEFGRAAADQGIRSTLSLPLLLDGDGIGALNLYSRREASFSDGDQAMAARFAEPAAALVTNALLFWEARDLADNLQTALTSRAVIDQAKGILMGQQRIDAEAAFDVLRRASQRENVKLRDIAQRLVDRVARPDPA